MTDRAVTYGSYLAIDDLLSLQRPRSDGPEHDELLFIVIHQVYELWFKELLHELDHVVALLGADDLVRSQHTLKRILTILKVQVGQLDILETMTPLEFQSFRARLEAASGFQSDQFRQLEYVLGHKTPGVVNRFPEGSRARVALERRLQAPTLWDAFVGLMARQGYRVPPGVLARDVTATVAPDVDLQAELVRMYRTDAGLAALAERLVDLDEGLQEWRYRHVKMVQRTIGMQPGTGGSSGAGYLQSTLMTPLFPDLWAIRSQL